MQIPLQLTFEGCEPSDTARAAIEREVERLEKRNSRIVGCRVAVIAPSQKHQHGTGFRVHIWLSVPPHENIVVNHVPSEDTRYEHVEVAIRDAFASARRQVDDHARRK
jgi:Sigma 54 modulation protein / S30EA ribosomal protein